MEPYNFSTITVIVSVKNSLSRAKNEIFTVPDQNINLKTENVLLLCKFSQVKSRKRSSILLFFLNRCSIIVPMEIFHNI